MFEPLSQFIDALKSDRKIGEYSEDQVKQGVILRALKLLGWDPFDIDEVTPEYSVESRRVDYALRVKRANKFFIEVKKPAEDLERHQEQLLDYSYREGVELAALTNGLTWWFYLPIAKGKWQDRKFYTVDIQAQVTSDIVQTLMNILSKDKVQDGEALKYADSISGDTIHIFCCTYHVNSPEKSIEKTAAFSTTPIFGISSAFAIKKTA